MNLIRFSKLIKRKINVVDIVKIHTMITGLKEERDSTLNDEEMYRSLKTDIWFVTQMIKQFTQNDRRVFPTTTNKIIRPFDEYPVHV